MCVSVIYVYIYIYIYIYVYIQAVFFSLNCRLLQAVCCSVLQAVCCRQCVAGSVLQCVAVCCGDVDDVFRVQVSDALGNMRVCCSLLQSGLQCVAGSVLQQFCRCLQSARVGRPS